MAKTKRAKRTDPAAELVRAILTPDPDELAGLDIDDAVDPTESPTGAAGQTQVVYFPADPGSDFVRAVGTGRQLNDYERGFEANIRAALPTDFEELKHVLADHAACLAAISPTGSINSLRLTLERLGTHRDARLANLRGLFSRLHSLPKIDGVAEFKKGVEEEFGCTFGNLTSSAFVPYEHDFEYPGRVGGPGAGKGVGVGVKNRIEEPTALGLGDLLSAGGGLLRRLQALTDQGGRNAVSEVVGTCDELSVLEAVRSWKIPDEFTADVVIPLLELVGRMLSPVDGSLASLQAKAPQRLEVAAHVSGLARFHPDSEVSSAYEELLARWGADPRIAAGLERVAKLVDQCDKLGTPQTTPYIPLATAAEQLGVKPAALQRYAQRHEGTFGTKVGRDWLFSDLDISRYRSTPPRRGLRQKSGAS